MNRSCILVGLLFISALGFAQQNSSIRIIGKIPDSEDVNLYQIQVGALFKPANLSPQRVVHGVGSARAIDIFFGLSI